MASAEDLAEVAAMASAPPKHDCDGCRELRERLGRLERFVAAYVIQSSDRGWNWRFEQFDALAVEALPNFTLERVGEGSQRWFHLGVHVPP